MKRVLRSNKRSAAKPTNLCPIKYFGAYYPHIKDKLLNCLQWPDLQSLAHASNHAYTNVATKREKQMDKLEKFFAADYNPQVPQLTFTMGECKIMSCWITCCSQIDLPDP